MYVFQFAACFGRVLFWRDWRSSVFFSEREVDMGFCPVFSKVGSW